MNSAVVLAFLSFKNSDQAVLRKLRIRRREIRAQQGFAYGGFIKGNPNKDLVSLQGSK